MVLLLIFSLASCGGKKDDDGEKNVGIDDSIIYNGQRVELGADAKELIPKLGSYSDVVGKACPGGIDSLKYMFSGLNITVYRDNAKKTETVERIEILNDSYTTEKGITIGSTRDEVIKAYGNNYVEGYAGVLGYNGENSAIRFHFGASDNVSNIYIERELSITNS